MYLLCLSLKEVVNVKIFLVLEIFIGIIELVIERRSILFFYVELGKLYENLDDF